MSNQSYTVRGKVGYSDNSPFRPEGFTVAAFDVIDATNRVPLGNPVALAADGTYMIAYFGPPQPTIRYFPDLLVRLLDSQGRIVAGFPRTYYGRDVAVDIALYPAVRQPSAFALSRFVKDEATGAILTGAHSKAMLRTSVRVLSLPC